MFSSESPIKEKGNPEPEFIPNEETVINLEHILPENPSDEWKHLDAETARTNYKRLGNMVLLQATKNNAIGNKGFDEKKPIITGLSYKNSKFNKHAQNEG